MGSREVSSEGKEGGREEREEVEQGHLFVALLAARSSFSLRRLRERGREAEADTRKHEKTASSRTEEKSVLSKNRETRQHATRLGNALAHRKPPLHLPSHTHARLAQIPLLPSSTSCQRSN